jgi:hypothetical protein
LQHLPELEGKAISVRFQPDLSALRGSLRSQAMGGTAVHAGSFLRQRYMILDRDLLLHPANLSRILVHELFHFVWLRLGNPRRRHFEQMLTTEIHGNARGELGWSSEWRKQRITPEDVSRRNRRWREYVCESFCDTAAFLFSECHRCAEYTLTKGHCERRRQWFARQVTQAIRV